MKIQGGFFVLILLCTAVSAQNTIMAWSKSNLGNTWRPGTEINSALSASQFTDLLHELAKLQVSRICSL